MKNTIGIIVPILVITIGVGWLLNVRGIVIGMDWVWTLSLAAVGLLSLIGGIDKFSIVMGPFLLFASLASVMRQTGKLRVEMEVPILVILLGVLLLIARLPMIPAPKWATEDDGKHPSDGRPPP